MVLARIMVLSCVMVLARVMVLACIIVLACVMVLACVLVLACAMILVHISFAQLVPRFLPSLSLRKFLAENNNFEMNCCHPNKTIEIGLFQEILQRLLKTHTRVFLFQNACKDFSLRQEQIQNIEFFDKIIFEVSRP